MGSGANDTFTVSGGSVTGSIDGGAVPAAAFTGDVTVTTTTITRADGDFTLGFAIGDRITTTFTGITVFVLTAVTATDLTVAGGLAAGTYLGAGISILTANVLMLGSASTVDLELETATDVAAFTNLTRIVASGAGNTLTGPVPLLDQALWTITGLNTGTVDVVAGGTIYGIAFEGFENLTGQDDSNDAFVFLPGGSIGGTIGGGGGTGVDGFAVLVGSELRAFQPTAAGTVLFQGVTVTHTGMEAFDAIGGDSANRVVKGSIFDRDFAVSVPGALTVTFTGLVFFGPGGGAGTITFTDTAPTDSLAIVSGTGPDEFTTALGSFTYALATYDDGELAVVLRNDGVGDEVMLELDGTRDAEGVFDDDVRTVDEGVRLVLTLGSAGPLHLGAPAAGVRSITIDGGGGNDTIRIDHAIGAVDPEDDSQCLVCLDIDGGGGTDTLYGPIDGTTWTIDALDGGSAVGITSFSHIENLVGGSDTAFGPAFDRFTLVVGGSISGSIDGGAGLDDQIIGPDQINTWMLTGADVGSVNGTDYVNIENPTGGGLADTFNVSPLASVTGVLGGGMDAPPPSSTPPALPAPPPPAPVDTLSFASFSTAVTVNLSLLTAPGIAAFAGIDSIVGGSSTNDLLLGIGRLRRERQLAHHRCQLRRGGRRPAGRRGHHDDAVQQLRESARPRRLERLLLLRRHGTADRDLRRRHRQRHGRRVRRRQTRRSSRCSRRPRRARTRSRSAAGSSATPAWTQSRSRPGTPPTRRSSAPSSPTRSSSRMPGRAS